MRVLVVGAGIGGLTAALAFQRFASVTLIERSPTASASGAGIILHVNAGACLAALGLAEPLVAAGRVLPAIELGDERGRTLSRAALPRVPRVPPPLALARGELHDILSGGLREVDLRLGCTATRVDPPTGEVELSHGQGGRFDLVVVAEGLGSTTRRALLGAQEPRRVYAGYTCWRALVEGQRDAAIEMLGRGQRVGLVPLSRGRLYTYWVMDAPAGSPRGTAADLRARFEGFGAEAQAALAGVRDDALLHHDLEYLSHHHFRTGRVVFLGDAAHGFTPNLGQGAAMAIEDAFTLGQVASHGLDEAALARWVEARQARVGKVSRQSQRVGWVGQWSHPAAVWLRRLLLAATPSRATERAAMELWESSPCARPSITGSRRATAEPAPEAPASRPPSP